MPIGTGTRLVSEIITAVKRQFGDESGTQINDADIIRWINQGQQEICIKEDLMRTVATTTSVALQAKYSIPAINILKLYRVDWDGIPLQNITFEQAQPTILETNEVANIQGTPTTWYEWGDSLYFYPTPAAAGSVISLFVTVLPTPVALSSDTLTIPDVYFNSILQYVLQQAYELDDDFGSAAQKAQQMEDTLSNIDPTASYRYYQTITIAREDA